MSAHICNDATTNALAQHALTRTGSTQERQRIANLLRAANTASDNSRYAENDALAKEHEQQFLVRTMHQDIARQVLRRLAALTPDAASTSASTSATAASSAASR